MASLTVIHAKASLLCSTPSSSHLEFKFPSKSQRSYLSTVKFRAKPLQACLIPATGDDDSGKLHYPFITVCLIAGKTKQKGKKEEEEKNRFSNLFFGSTGENLDWVCNRRRILICVSTLPFLYHLRESLEGFSAEAAELDTTTYVLMKEEVRKVVSKGKAAGVLRLVFHDAGTFETVGNSGGMNGSIVFELDRPENAGLKKSLKILEKAKIEVDAKQSVSWADMIAVAGAEAVSVCGGPTIPVILGRLDSAEPDAEGKLPEESLGASSLKQCFQRKGLSTRELVALSGAHTIGSKGFGNPTVFDNSYYKILLEKPWMSSAGMSSMIGLPSDRALVEDDECLRWIKKYADDQDIFFDDFKNAYIKLVNSGARWKSL